MQNEIISTSDCIAGWRSDSGNIQIISSTKKKNLSSQVSAQLTEAQFSNPILKGIVRDLNSIALVQCQIDKITMRLGPNLLDIDTQLSKIDVSLVTIGMSNLETNLVAMRSSMQNILNDDAAEETNQPKHQIPCNRPLPNNVEHQVRHSLSKSGEFKRFLIQVNGVLDTWVQNSHMPTHEEKLLVFEVAMIMIDTVR